MQTERPIYKEIEELLGNVKPPAGAFVEQRVDSPPARPTDPSDRRARAAGAAMMLAGKPELGGERCRQRGRSTRR